MPNKISPLLIQLANKKCFDQQAKIMAKRKRFGHNDFKLQDKVFTQNLKTKKWDIQGEIVELVKSQDLNSCSFAIKTKTNEVIWRSSCYIRLDLTQPTNQNQTNNNILQSMKIIQSW